MCGICGEVRKDDNAPDVGAVARINKEMTSRGPDGAGVWSQGKVALAHRRLRIIDLSEGGSQPMVDPDLGLTITFNGCIYNYPELRDELRKSGYRFFSTSDTEVLLKAYHKWGEDFVSHLKGMFAFCIVERDSGRVVLGRDRLGIKPLYLAETDSRLRFASTLPALLAGGGVDTTVDPVALHHYMMFHAVVPAPHTILKGIRKLDPATLLIIEPDGRRRKVRYWNPAFARNPDHDGMTENDWQDAILLSLKTAVERRMVSDVPVGVLLSGGLDSSIIVGLLAELGQKNLQTFSVGFEAVGGIEGDEFEFSDLIADHYGTDHHKLMVSSEKMLPALGQAIGAMSEPMVSHDVVGFYLLSGEVAKHLKVVQSGQGADEVFAGYGWYPPLEGAEDSGLDTYEGEFFDRPRSEMEDAISPEYLAATDVSREFAEAHFDQPGADTPLDRALRLDSRVMLVDDPVKRVDNMTMAWGLEARVPFLDHDLVELAAACPTELKLAHDGKGVLKEASRRVIPNRVIDRPKGYFPVPALKHLEGRYLDLVREALNAPEARERGLFGRAYVDHHLAAPNDGKTRLGSNKLWQLGLLELWLQERGV
ncbi:N-acetylglutaminylglutamine amidotransferase [Rubrobacter indicoceani]|uniref:N-acetylglutaminylglutamine amidotransferase n=1 Tax=Rubrobacter indicoceani TaxID=2051957 RepID=UPI000E5B47CD|nr:N-acetylglutaminylglutamine amidotransferase [Rubrobacter indicoceani]